MGTINQRKNEHIELSESSQVLSQSDQRFFYEPLFGSHEEKGNLKTNFLGKAMNFPFVISSMTGGSERAHKLNHVMARACKRLGIGMNLGSCRVLIESSDRLDDFMLREILGDELPFFSNYGIAQIAQYFENQSFSKVMLVQDQLEVDGMIVHINPLQEYFQFSEGDKFKESSLETLKKLRDKYTGKLIVKEVGQGFGPRSLEALVSLGVDCIELSGFGGTNFTKLEGLRAGEKTAFEKIGHNCLEMIEWLNKEENKPNIIISGGVKTSLDAYYLREIYQGPSIIGQASKVLDKALESEDALVNYVKRFFNDYQLAESFLRVKK